MEDRIECANPATPMTKRTAASLWFWMAALIAVLLYLTSLYSYALFHAVAELATIVVIFSASSVALSSRHLLKNGYLLVLSLGCSFYAAIILIHTLTYKGVGIIAVSPDVPTQFWIAGRYLLAASFLLAGRFSTRSIRLVPVLLVYLVTTVTIVVSIMYFKVFPVCFVEGAGLTPFKKVSEIIIAAIFMVAAADLVWQRTRHDATVFRLLSAFLVCCILTEFFFIFYVSVYGISNLLGHLINLAGFVLFYQAIVKTAIVDPYRLIFRELAQSNESLELRVQERTAQLSDTSRFLRESQLIAGVGGWKSNPTTGMLYWTDELYHLLERPFDYRLDHDTGFENFAPAFREEVQQALQLAWEENRPFSIECQMVTVAGRFFWVEMRCNGRTEDRRGNYLMGTIQDITERKNVENSLLAAKKAAEAANRTKDEFLSTISHELRTPLNGIMGGAQLIELTDLNSEQQEYLEMINYSVARELALVDDLLELTSIEADTVQLAAVQFRLADTLAAVVNSYQQECAAKGLVLALTVGEGVPVSVEGDASRVKQLLRILLDNAIKFTRQGGITVAVYAAGQLATRHDIVIEVSDSGVGIPADMLDTVFEPFVQADMSRTRQFEGTGLGLAICRRLATRMGGSVTVSSVEGQGSCFRLELPFAVQPVESLATIGVADCPSNRPLKVLVVEDDQINQSVIVKALQHLGHLAVVAENGAVGLDMWRHGDFDLILMDILMPVQDGVATMQAIRREESGTGKRIPIVVLTADVIRSAEQQMLAAGFDGYLAKPMHMQELREQLQKTVLHEP